MKFLAVKFSDLAGPLNPAGILSQSWLTLKLVLERGDVPAVTQALYDWLSQRRPPISPEQVDQILTLPDVDAAVDALLALVGGGLKGTRSALPPQVQQVLRQAVQRIAQQRAGTLRRGVDRAHRAITDLDRFGENRADALVARLLA